MKVKEKLLLREIVEKTVELSKLIEQSKHCVSLEVGYSYKGKSTLLMTCADAVDVADGEIQFNLCSLEPNDDPWKVCYQKCYGDLTVKTYTSVAEAAKRGYREEDCQNAPD